MFRGRPGTLRKPTNAMMKRPSAAYYEPLHPVTTVGSGWWHALHCTDLGMVQGSSAALAARDGKSGRLSSRYQAIRVPLQCLPAARLLLISLPQDLQPYAVIMPTPENLFHTSPTLRRTAEASRELPPNRKQTWRHLADSSNPGTNLDHTLPTFSATSLVRVFVVAMFTSISIRPLSPPCTGPRDRLSSQRRPFVGQR